MSNFDDKPWKIPIFDIVCMKGLSQKNGYALVQKPLILSHIQQGKQESNTTFLILE